MDERQPPVVQDAPLVVRSLDDDAGALPTAAPTITRGARDELTLAALLGLLLRRWWVIALAAAVVFGGVYAVGARLGKKFESVAWLRITQPDQNTFTRSAGVVGLAGGGGAGAGQQAVLLTVDSPLVQQTLRSAFGSRSGDVESVAAAGLQSSPLVRVTVVAGTADLARSAADRVAQAIVTNRRDAAAAGDRALAAQLRAQLPGFQKQIDAINASLPPVIAPATTQPSGAIAQRDALIAQYKDFLSRANQLDAQAAVESGGLVVDQPATLPSSPTFPQPSQWGVLGAAAAVVLAVAGLWATEEMRRSRARRRTAHRAAIEV